MIDKKRRVIEEKRIKDKATILNMVLNQQQMKNEDYPNETIQFGDIEYEVKELDELLETFQMEEVCEDTMLSKISLDDMLNTSSSVQSLQRSNSCSDLNTSSIDKDEPLR